MVQDAAYGTLLRGRRQQLHARIAATLEDQFPEIVVAQPALLARHCAEAGLAEKAVGYWLKAGEQAIPRGAITEAVAQLRKGLDLLSDVPDGVARQEQELDLQGILGWALTATKGLAAPEAGEAFARARDLCERLNRPSRLGPILLGQCAFHLVRGELDQAEHYAERMRHLGDGDSTWKFMGWALSGTACSFLGKFIEARAHLENALTHRVYLARSPTRPIDPYVSILTHLSRTLLCLGYFDRARLRRDEAVAEARRRSPYNLAYALVQVSYGDWTIRGIDSARTILRSAEEVIAISSEQGFSEWFGIGNIMRGWCLTVAGVAAEGIPLLRQGIANYRATGANLLMPFYLTILAEALGMGAQPQAGLDRLAEAAKLVETTQERWSDAEMYRLRGMLLLTVHDVAAAENSFRQALTTAHHQTAKLWELRAATSLARLWRDQDKRTEARDLLAPIYGWFTEGFDTPVLQDAKALCDELA
jgi:predicted ATPase